jgi:hypothetical protein
MQYEENGEYKIKENEMESDKEERKIKERV